MTKKCGLLKISSPRFSSTATFIIETRSPDTLILLGTSNSAGNIKMYLVKKN